MVARRISLYSCFIFLVKLSFLIELQGFSTQASWLQPLLKKRSAFPIGGSGAIGASQPSQSPSSSGPPQNPSAALDDLCKIKPLTQRTWSSLKLDSYLEKYLGGQNITLANYASSKGISNFQCGIGYKCSAGQPCYPVPPPDWYILFAVQQWNANMNAIKTALTYSMGFVKSTMASLFAALIPALDTYQLDRMKLNYGINGAITMCSNTVFLDIASFFHDFQDATGDVLNIINNVMGAAFSFAGGFINPPDPPEGQHREAFNAWAHMEKEMAAYEELLVGALSNETAKVIEAGISTEAGIYGKLKNGTFVKPVQAIFLPLFEDDIKNVTIAVSLVKTLRMLDSFVTIGQDVCNHNGKNGAFPGDDVLSYCDPEGTMYNIVKVKGKESEDRTFQNAWSIENRFGYSTQLLTNASWSCQKKYGGFEHFPYNNTLPRDVLADCIINLPVCDCRHKDIRKSIKKHGLIRACRMQGLPI